jgi:hypothetical protein
MAVKKIAKQKKDKSESLVLRNYAFILFCNGIAQTDIALRCEVSEKTITQWKQKNDWDTKLAAKKINMDELVNKCLMKISTMLDDENFNADSFAKAVAQLKSLKPSNTIDNEIMTFMGFQDFLLERRHDENIEEKFIKAVASFQDRYIKKKLGYNG